MAYNGSGTFVPLTAPNYPAVDGTVIVAAYYNAVISDLISGLNKALCRDGQAVPTANLPMGGFKLTGIGAASVNGEAVEYGQYTTALAGLATQISDLLANLTVTTSATLPAATTIGAVTAAEIAYLQGLTGNIQTLFARLASPAFTGTPTAPTAASTDNSTQIANMAAVQSVAMNASLPNQAGNAGKVLYTDGTDGYWGTLAGAVPIGSLLANKNVGNSFAVGTATWLRTGVISPTATYPLAPTTTINDGATWLTKTGISLLTPALAANGSGTVIAIPYSTNDTGYAISTDYGATWSAATLPASISGLPVWCGTFFLIVNLNASAATTTFYTSPTGVTGSWTARTVPSNIYKSAVYGEQGCIITTSTTQGYITTDGINYTSITMPIAAMSGTFGNGFYVFVNPTASLSVHKTFNGLSFVTKTVPIEPRVSIKVDPFAFGEGVFLYAQDSVNAKCFTTTDFENFTVSNTGIPTAASYTRTFGNGTFLLSRTGSVSATAYTSDDLGVTWTARTLPSSSDWSRMEFTGTSFVAMQASTTNAIQSVSGGVYTDTAKAMFADSPENTRPLYMRVA